MARLKMNATAQDGMGAQVAPAEAAGVEDDSKYDFSYTQNRELSWLQFDNRVLDEARDESVPLLERLKMAAIFQSNMDEFYMIRVGSLSELAALKIQPIDNKSNQTPSEQVAAIYEAMPALITKHEDTVRDLEAALAERGVVRVTWDTYTARDAAVVDKYFNDSVSPIISPQIIDPRHPFPNLHNDTLYAVYNLASSEEAEILGMVEVPPTLSRVFVLPSDSDQALRYTLVEDVILRCAPALFGEYHTAQRAVIRVTRNADIDPDEGSFDLEEDYRSHMKKILKQRLHLNPVRLEVQGDFSKTLLKQMRKALELTSKQVITTSAPIDMGGFVYSLEGLVPKTLAEDLCYPPFSPQPSTQVDPNRPMWEQIRERDIMLFYPYESMDPFLRLIHESATDPDVMQIKITLYRVAKKSRLCESLIAAAENGVDVTVLMELRARFDEENNIEWAGRLEDAGCTVLFGSAGFKVHSKICQITRRSKGEVVRITQLGTGNYNEKTAGLYSDYCLMTADTRIGEDTNRFFRNMQIGNLQGEYTTLGVAPISLKPIIIRGLNREIAKARAGEEAYAFLKMNSITDREVIDKIAEASTAGVRVDMIVRGISCLVPGVPGKTENVHIRSIVGRYLEHARVYSFGTDHDIIYLSSADMMTRNTEHRVEVAYPLLAQSVRDQVVADMEIQLSDNDKARELAADGFYHPIPHAEGEPVVNAQATFVKRALKRAREAELKAAKEANKRRFTVETAPMHVTVDEEAQVEAAKAAAAAEDAERAAAEAMAAEEALATEAAQAADKVLAAEAAQVAAEKAEEAAAQAQPADVTPSPAQPAVQAVDPALVAQLEAITSKLADMEKQINEVSAAAQAEKVEAKPIPETPKAEEPAEPQAEASKAQAEVEPSKAIELMVSKQGRSATGWALIKAGLRVLFHGSAK